MSTEKKTRPRATKRQRVAGSQAPFGIVTEKWVYERCSVELYVDERKLKKYGWPAGKTWVVGATKAELKKLGLEVFQTCNCNGTWHYMVDEAKAEAILRDHQERADCVYVEIDEWPEWPF